MQIVELAKYLGIGYRDLASSPRWFLEVAGIRMNEENEYHKFVNRKNSPPGA